VLGVFKYFLENIEMILAEVGIRVRYQETDQMGVVYHGNYFTWFEAARIELLDQLGCPYRNLEKDGYLLPVLHCEAKFRKPAHFDDRLVVRVSIKEPPSAKIQIYYQVFRNQEVLCTGNTTHAFIDHDGKLVRPPAIFLKKIKESMGQE
jgi:acyl-CoA thioester hydrolase